jgi:hypothetical protein
MMEAVRTSEPSVDNHFTRQYNPEDSSEHQTKLTLQVTDADESLWCVTLLLRACQWNSNGFNEPGSWRGVSAM